MFEKTQFKSTRSRVTVKVTLTSGVSATGDLFVARDQRITDLLNDERAFLPLDTADAACAVIAKGQIVSVDILGTIEEDDDEDPFGILRVEPCASDAEVRDAWMRRLKAAHPDRLMALDLDPSIIRAARQASQRINAAYDQIVAARKSAA